MISLYNFNILKKQISNKYFIEFLESLKIIKDTYANIKIFPYVTYKGYPFYNNGYSNRTHKILTTFNEMYEDKVYIGVHKLGFPWNESNLNKNKYNKFLNRVDNVFYLTLPNIKQNNYNILIHLLKNYLNLTTFHVASDHSNALPIINYCNTNKLVSIYELRGMWHMTGYSRFNYFNMRYNNRNSYTAELNEKKCINNCTIPLFITQQLKDYAKKETKYKEFPALNCNFNDYPVFWNAFNIKNKIINKKNNNDKFIIGYIGSIVYYEGLYEAITYLEKIQNYHRKKIEIHLVGRIHKLYKNHMIKKKIFQKPFVFFHGEIPHTKVVEMLSSFDLYIIPRLDVPVTNIVSPIKPFEPMSLKIPLLMSDCDALKDIAQNGKNCMLFQKNNYFDFLEKIKTIIDNGYDEKILENGYNFVKNERNWNAIIKNIGLYEMLK